MDVFYAGPPSSMRGRRYSRHVRVMVVYPRDGAKKVLAIYEPRFIFTAASLRVDGLPTQVTTELPGNESTLGPEPLDDR